MQVGSIPAAALVRRYFAQLTEGCGRRSCPNRHCFSCVDGPGHLDRTTAALRALELAQGNTHELCEDQPPFLHLQLVRGMVADAARTGEWRPLEKEVSGVFSNSDALNRSYLQSDTERQQLAEPFGLTADLISGVDTNAVAQGYTELLKLHLKYYHMSVA